jgi:hypothetical protein
MESLIAAAGRLVRLTLKLKLRRENLSASRMTQARLQTLVGKWRVGLMTQSHALAASCCCLQRINVTAPISATSQRQPSSTYF